MLPDFSSCFLKMEKLCPFLPPDPVFAFLEQRFCATGSRRLPPRRLFVAAAPVSSVCYKQEAKVPQVK